jgi:hypothetical protein
VNGIAAPRLASWLLERCTPGRCDEALAGDLLEDFRSRRARGWYWRQVLAALAIAWSRELGGRAVPVLFAVSWSMLAPAWLLAIAHLEKNAGLAARLARMEWPWPGVFETCLLLAANLLFIWAGIVLYLIPRLSIARNLRLRLLARGILASLPVLFVLWAALILLPKYFLDLRSVHRNAVAQTASDTFGAPMEKNRIRAPLSPAGSNAATDPESSRRFADADQPVWSVLVRLPFFLVVMCALWKTAPIAAGRRKNAAAE